MPPDRTIRAQAIGGELGLQHAVEDHPRQRISWLSLYQAGTGRARPDLEQLFGSHLVGNMPMGNTGLRLRPQQLKIQLPVFLQFHPPPVYCKLRRPTPHRNARG